MTTNAWAHLPNAQHIDWVLASLERNPQAWDAARVAARDAARGAAWGAAWDACSAFIAWDGASDVWAMPTDAVRLLAAVGNHCAVLLMPACVARDRA